MKSQISIDFIVSIILFIIFSTYIFFRVLILRPAYLNELKNEEIRSEAFQISEILVKDGGEPSNWYTNPNRAKRIGLMNETYNQSNLLSTLKIDQLNNLCKLNYDEVRRLIGSQDLQFSIQVVDMGNNKVLLSCTPKQIRVRTFGISFKIERVIALDSGSYGILSVTVW